MASLTEETRKALKAIFSLDYHIAIARGQSGDPEYQRWLARKPSSIAIPPPGPLSSALFDRLKERLADIPPNDFMSRHVAGSIAAAIVAAAKRDTAARRQSWVDLGSETGWFNASTLGNLDELRTGELTPAQAYANATHRGGCAPDKVEEEVNFDEGSQISTAKVKLEVNVAIDKFAKRFDPRRWDVRASSIFVRADEVDRQNPPGDLSEVPAKTQADLDVEKQVGAAGQSIVDGRLYENAVLAIEEDVLLDFHNVLGVNYQADPLPAQDRRIELTYSLHQALALTVEGGETFENGLDVDSGFATVKELTGGRTAHEATKSIRFQAPPDRRDVYNWNAFISLKFWLKSLLVQGVCIP